jgi:branched-chain amino acid transport system permease protein
VFLPLLGREVTVYKAGIVLIFFVAAIGLHLLINWAGELSLAHAGMVGLPAFAVLAASATFGTSPVYLLPMGIVAGAITGAIVGLPTLRTRGIQVALVTLVAGIAIDRFFFTQGWLVGNGPRTTATPALGPLEFATSRATYPILVTLAAGAVIAATSLYRSKLARAWFWIRANPDAAAAFGIPVYGYRLLAYVVSGAFAGLAGGMYTMWVQSFGRDAFPTTTSFTFLLLAVLGGPGFLGGLAVATLLVQGGPQFSSDIFGTNVGKTVATLLAYGGPIGLIRILTTYKTGFNGLGRNLMARIRIGHTS